jgi:hypothetical protein
MLQKLHVEAIDLDPLQKPQVSSTVSEDFLLTKRQAIRPHEDFLIRSVYFLCSPLFLVVPRLDQILAL